MLAADEAMAVATVISTINSGGIAFRTLVMSSSLRIRRGVIYHARFTVKGAMNCAPTTPLTGWKACATRRCGTTGVSPVEACRAERGFGQAGSREAGHLSY